MDFIGERISLKNWRNYSGGLDTKMDSTGKEAIYHKTKSSEFIFHVSTLLPEEEGGTTEYLSKKRHIGNDIVVIIFSDDPNFVIPDIVSQYNRKKSPANF